MAPKLWRQSYGAKGIKMHAFIDYHRFGICYHQMSSACAYIHSRGPCSSVLQLCTTSDIYITGLIMTNYTSPVYIDLGLFS